MNKRELIYKKVNFNGMVTTEGIYGSPECNPCVQKYKNRFKY